MSGIKRTKKNIIIISLFFGVLSFFLIIFLIIPLLKNISQDLKIINEEEKNLITAKEESINFHRFKDSYKKTEDNLKKIDGLFADKEVPIGLIQFLEQSAKEYNLSVNIFPYNLKAKKDSPWNYIGFQINAEGNFPDFSKFLERIESGPYLLSSQRLVLSRLVKKGHQETNSIKAVLLLKAFTK